MLCFILGHLCSQYGDIELPDDDPVQCGSEFCVICNVDTEELVIIPNTNPSPGAHDHVTSYRLVQV